MGNELAKNAGGLTLPPVRTAEPAAARGTLQRNPGTAAPAAPAARTDNGTGTPARTPAARAEEKEKAAGLAPVKSSPDEAKAPAPNAPQKQQRRKKSPAKKQANNSGFNAEQISALILSVSTITASRPGLEVFALTQTEAMQIATPLANMIAKSETLSKAGEYSDAISLVTACLVVMVPRLLVYNDQQKKKKLEKNGGLKIVREEKPRDGGNRRDSKPSPAPAQNDAVNAAAVLPTFS